MRGVRGGAIARTVSAAALVAIALALLAPAQAFAKRVARLTSSAGPIDVVEVARGLEHPWSLAFLPDARMLVTERPGRLRIVTPAGAISPPLEGVAKVHANGQGGLLDIALGPTFADDGVLLLSYAQPTADGARTAVARARIDWRAPAPALTGWTVVFAQRQAPSGGHHWGSRLQFARDGSLFVTLGDRYSYRDQAQDLSSHLGKIVRILPDGRVPPDNPFLGKPGALAEIWSYGHRNVQGAALHPLTGRLWTHEHGPQGGDEVNIGVAGANYGWPVITYGREYVIGTRIGEGTSRADVQAPLHQWTPSIAPSGMAFYTGDRMPSWRGSLFVGALRGQMLVRLEFDGERLVREERLLEGLRERIRDVRQGPDGLLYLLTDSDEGRILRIEPAR